MSPFRRPRAVLAAGPAPRAAGKTTVAGDSHLPFPIGAGTTAPAIPVLATGHRPLAGPRAAPAAEAVPVRLRAFPEPLDAEADLLLEGARE